MTGTAGFARYPYKNKTNCPGRTGVHQGRVVYGAIEEVVFGHPATEAIVAQMDRLGTRRAFLMVSGTLNRETDEIEEKSSRRWVHAAPGCSMPCRRTRRARR